MDQNNNNEKIIGLIAGDGNLPVLVSQHAQEKGYKVYAVCFDIRNYPQILLNSTKALHCAPGQAQKILDFLVANNIKELFFIGKIPKTILFKNPKLDWYAIRSLSKLKKYNDNSIMLHVAEALHKEGITVIEQTKFIKDFFAKKGLICGQPLTPEQEAGVYYGFETAKKIGDMDIGQTVVVKDMMILAIEAIEGTDRAIKRGCKLARGKAIVVKVSKPNQDQRFDIPVVGLKTLKTMKKYGATVLAIEANETLIVDETNFINLATKYGMTVIAV